MPNNENSESEKLLAKLTENLPDYVNDFLDEMAGLVWAGGKSMEEALQIANKENVSKDEINKVVDILNQVGKLHQQETEENFNANRS